MRYKSIYVAASSQHVGKTTSTLGLMQVLKRQGMNVGYCKPVGQRFFQVEGGRADKDAVLFSDVMGFHLIPTVHSPVILGPGATAEYIDHPEWSHYDSRIIYAAQIMESKYDFMIYEGTGHPGVGAVVDLSNARVAKMLGSDVVVVVEGGIGRTIDMLAMCLARFRKEDVPVAGVIINKVRPDKLEAVRKYVGMWLVQQGIPLLGLLPYNESMGYPIMKMVCEVVDGVTIFNEHKLGNKVQQIFAGSLLEVDDIAGQNVLLVVSTQRVDYAIQKVAKISEQRGFSESPLAGIIATGVGTIGQATVDYIKRYDIPLVRTALDTYGSMLKVSAIEVKIHERTPWKVELAFDMIANNVQVDSLVKPL
jgi:dethiobiotin synthetase